MSDPHGGHPDTGHADGGHPSEALGPIDVAMWSVGVLGLALGLLVALCVAFATGVL